MLRGINSFILFSSMLISFSSSVAAVTLVGDFSAASTSSGDRFGSVIAIDGENVVVGAPSFDIPGGEDIGAAYIFENGAEVIFFEGLNPVILGGRFEFDEFGSSVAIDGETIVIGAINGDDIDLVEKPRTDGNGNPVTDADGVQLVDLVPEVQTPNGGLFRIIRRSPDTGDWIAEGSIVLENGNTGDWLGYSLDTEDNQIVVGAPLRDLDEATPDAGMVFALTRHTSNWFDPNDDEGDELDPGVISQNLQPVGLKSQDWFGNSVAISNGTVVVGAEGSDLDGPASGAAYVFTYNQDGTWQQQARLRPSNAGEYQFFGRSVSISGNTIVVGAYLANEGKGAAYVFKRGVDGIWSERAVLTDSAGVIDDHFGSAVAVDGSVVLVGAYRRQEPTLPIAPGSTTPQRQGAAYVFFEDTSAAWQLASIELASASGTPENFDDFAFSVALSGYSAAIGIPEINSSDAGHFRHITGLDSEIDTDGDGQTNDVDLDDDNDGVRDVNDRFPTDPNEYSDIDGDGFGDNSDAFIFNPTESFDSDGDGIGNNLDTDDDNDGFSDFAEVSSDQDPLTPDPGAPAADDGSDSTTDDTSDTTNSTGGGGDSGSFGPGVILLLLMMSLIRRRLVKSIA